MHRKAGVTRYLVQAMTTEQCLLYQILIASDLVVYQQPQNISILA